MLLVGMFVFLIISWPNIPAQVPLHSNWAGEVDRWGGPGNVIISPILGVLLYIILSIVSLPLDGGVISMPLPEDAKPVAIRLVRGLMSLLKVITLLFCAANTVFSVNGSALPGYLLIVFLALLLVPTVVVVLRIFRLRQS